MLKKIKSIYTLLLILLIGVAVFSGWKILSILSEYRQSESSYDDLTEQYVEPTGTDSAPHTDTVPTDNDVPELVEVETELNEVAPICVSFEELQAQCKDVVAWIYCEDTPINYPIVQGTDNSYYLRRLLDGTWNIAGSIFMDYRNVLDFSDWNTIIYGHNMKNDSMFGSLESYRTQEYYDANSIIYLLTPEQDYKIELIGGYVTDGYAEDTYTIPTSLEERDKLIEKANQESTFQSEVMIDVDDRIVTLSTCTYDFDGARYVVIGVLRELG